MTTPASPTTSAHETAVLDAPRPAVRPRLWPAIGLMAFYWIAWGVVTVFYPATFEQF